VSLVKENKIKDGKTLAKHCNAQKWVKAKKGLVNGLPWCMPTKEWMTNDFLEGEW